jgi:amidase
MDATELAYAGAAEQARLIREGQASAREVVEATLERIAHLDPALRAYRVVFGERALAEADAIDSQGGAADKPLAGVPVAIKDDADVEGEITAWGTSAYGDPKPVDSDVVTRLREAGAIVIGKTNVPEMTMWPWTLSATFGSVRNPWGTDRTPGGSSGGSAAATATGMCGVALGSDGGGSIRYPAACCGLFGIKTQRDRISLGPDHHDAWNGLSVYGPIARSVADAALFLDATSTSVPGEGFSAALAEPVEPLRVAVSVKPPQGSLARLGPEQRGAIEGTAELLRSLGHTVIEHEVDLPFTVILNLTMRYLKGLRHDTGTMPRAERLERNTRRMAALGGLLPEGWLEKARRDEPGLAARLNAVFDSADVVLMPMLPGQPPRITDLTGHGAAWSFNRAATEVAYTAPWNVIGQPAASVPAGFDADGLPLAVQLCGRAGDEVTLLRLSAQIEAARPWAQSRPPVESAAALAPA